MNHTIKVATLLYLLVFISCNGDENKPTDFGDCKYGKPGPVFSTELSQVKEHAFSIKKMEALESVKFTNGSVLELTQSGCDHIKQEFQFFLEDYQAGNFDNTIQEAVKQLKLLGQLSEKYAVFAFWANAIETEKMNIKKGQPTEVQPNRFVKIDIIPGNNQAILIVEFLNQ